MADKLKPTNTQPEGQQGKTGNGLDDMLVNDSLGTVNLTDSSGLEKEKETPEEKTGFVKKDNGGPRED